MTDIIKLNVGGIIFNTTKNTLTNTLEPNYFNSILSKHWETCCDKDENIFIDRDGEYFKPILNFLRTGVIYIEPDIPQHLVFLEAEFYGINLIDLAIKQNFLHKFTLDRYSDFQCVSKNSVVFPFDNIQISRFENNHRIYDIEFEEAYLLISLNPKYIILEKTPDSFICVSLARYQKNFNDIKNCYFHYI